MLATSSNFIGFEILSLGGTLPLFMTDVCDWDAELLESHLQLKMKPTLWDYFLFFLKKSCALAGKELNFYATHAFQMVSGISFNFSF